MYWYIIKNVEEICFHFDSRQFIFSTYVQNCQILTIKHVKSNGGMWEYFVCVADEKVLVENNS